MRGTCGNRKHNFSELHRMVSFSIGALAPQHLTGKHVVAKEASHG
jgi:hypothetical protein